MLVPFFLVTFGITWAAWSSSRVLADAAFVGGVFGIGGPVFLLGVFAPAIVAIALTWRAAGPAGVHDLLAPIGRWR
jgi:hypothetical protein